MDYQDARTTVPAMPPFTPQDKDKFQRIFVKSDPGPQGLLSGEKVQEVFVKSKLPNETLRLIWNLADTQDRGQLDSTEFAIAMYLIQSMMNGQLAAIPHALPPGFYQQVSGCVFGEPGPVWDVTPTEKANSDRWFDIIDTAKCGYIQEDVAIPFLLESKLSREDLARIWDLADINKESRLTRDGFAVVWHLIQKKRYGVPLPTTLPPSLVPPMCMYPSAPVVAPAPPPKLGSFSLEGPVSSPALVPITSSATPDGANPSVPSIKILVYESLLLFLKGACNAEIPGRSSSEVATLQTILDGYFFSMASSHVVAAIVESSEYRKTLLQLSSELGLSHDPNLRTALRRGDERIASLLVSIFHSKSAEEAVLRLQSDSAQYFLDVVQDTLDKGFLLAEEKSRMARRIIRKLSESCDRLPSSLFITGVSGREEHPTFGGGYGDIFRASYDNKPVALKRMRYFLRGSDLRSIHLKLCREALVWKDLHHPHILPFLGIDRDTIPSALCLVSPWMEHGTVINYLKAHGHANIDKLLHEITQGLQYLHSRNIVHGDLRGANILINEDWSACLADFGLSRFSDATSSMSTNRGGSLYWMAPELIDPGRFGHQFARTPATDVYAFGCVCVELYTGRPPFYDLNEPAALIRILNGERPERPSGPPAMSDILWQHVTEFWAQDISARPVTQVVVQNMAWPAPPALTPFPVSSSSMPVLPLVPLVPVSSTLPPSSPINSDFISPPVPSSLLVKKNFRPIKQNRWRLPDAIVPSKLFKNGFSFSKHTNEAVAKFTEAYDMHADPDKIDLEQTKKRARMAEKALEKVSEPRGPVCSICFSRCRVSANPWQCTRIDRMEIDDSDDEHRPRKPVTHGIRLASCRHYFCGACLARAIYLRLNIKFDPATYGTVLGPPVVDKPGLHAKWPVYCPTCIKPEVQHVPLSDVTVLEVLGKPNIEEWNHARLLSTLELIQCPHEGCEEAFPPNEGSKPHMQCPRCGGSLCKACKCVWHENMTCEKYRAIPITERTPEDADFMNLAKQEKWRRCPNCSAMVELKFGCNHITCVCSYRFCYICGAPFEYENGRHRCTGGENCPISEKIIDAYDGHINTNKIALQQTREGIQALERVSEPRGPVCSICFSRCRISANPWMCARIDRMEIDDSDDEGEPRKPVTHGIRLASCRHYFCGACLAQAIYLRLNIKFDPTTYGTVLGPPVAAKPGLHAKWPVYCPTCMKPEAQCAPLSDVTALQVLGKPNIEDWNHRRFLSMLNLIQCPHKGCEEAFPSDEGSEPLMQCPRCGGSLCHVCKCVWHENMTCESYQAMPISERTPEDPDFMNLAKQVKWRRCPNCSTVVELKFGFNHITCVCEHHFCYTCGAPFEYENGRYRCTGGENCVVWEEQKVDDY